MENLCPKTQLSSFSCAANLCYSHDWLIEQIVFMTLIMHSAQRQAAFLLRLRASQPILSVLLKFIFLFLVRLQHAENSLVDSSAGLASAGVNRLQNLQDVFKGDKTYKLSQMCKQVCRENK